MEQLPVAYIKVFLSGIAGIFLGLVLPGLLNAFKGIREQKATGLGAVAGGFAEGLFSPLLWIIAISFFAAFFVAGRADSRLLRVLFFWIPTLLMSIAALVCVGLFIYSRRA